MRDNRLRSAPARISAVLAIAAGGALIGACSQSATSSSSSTPPTTAPHGTPTTVLPIGEVTVPVEGRPAPALPPEASQIEVLTKALQKIQSGFRQFAETAPGPTDVADYDLAPLWTKGIDGAGTTIALIEGWSDPTIGEVVDQFDSHFGLPNPDIETIFPSGDGRLPARCPPGMVVLAMYGSCKAWSVETMVDVLSAHLMAPYARILISVTPPDSEIVDDAACQVAPPEMMRALEVIAAGKLANVISISDGTGESTYSRGLPELTAQDPGELAAAEAGIPVLVATGDTGAAQALPVSNADMTTTRRSTAAWDDSPWVSAVGGTIPAFAANGRRVGADPLWNGSGAGYSAVFKRPAYQDAVATGVGDAMRSVPDITMDSRYGTSEASPLFAGIVALATQLNGGADVGPVNPALYATVGPAGAADGIVDVVAGNDTHVDAGGARVPGFSAAPGFDVASGWGTISAPLFVAALVAATDADHQEETARTEAATQLASLVKGIRLTPSPDTSATAVSVTGSGFLPGHPVQLVVDGHRVALLTATAGGSVSYLLTPSRLRFAGGGHTVELKSMLIDESAQLQVG